MAEDQTRAIQLKFNIHHRRFVILTIIVKLYFPGAIEGAYAIKHQKLVEVSEQQLVDCDKSDGGCGGGLMSNAIK